MSISAGRLVAGSCTACGNAMQCPFEAVASASVHAQLVLPWLLASAERLTSQTKSQELALDPCYSHLTKSLLQRVHMFILALHSSRPSLQTSQKLNA